MLDRSMGKPLDTRNLHEARHRIADGSFRATTHRIDALAQETAFPSGVFVRPLFT
jgi:hypothetical protein